MKQRIVWLWFLTLAVAGRVFASDIVINEIMYHPYPVVPENTALEWVELYNRGTNTVNLAGWRFTDGVEFTFPTNSATVLAPGGYLVVAANRSTFQLLFPMVANVVGDWVGQLSNNGERIRLADAQGEEVNSVTYADAGDWAVRQRVPDPMRSLPGWEWLALPDGQGSSLELINPAMPNNAGQNWAPSLISGGTPGSPNTVFSRNIAPLILEMAHFPPVPKSTDQVTVTARIVDELPGGLTVTLYYRDATSTTPPAFSSMPMFDDGAHNDGVANDGVYGATLPPYPNATVVEFYVQASDGANTRTWPAPALVNGTPSQAANALFQVDDSVYAGDQPILRIVMTGSERQQLQSNSSNSDAQQNITLVSIDGVETLIRYCGDIRVRGAGSRSRQVKNHRVNLPSDRPWKGMTAMNLNSQYIHAQMVGSVIAQKSGLPAASARIVQVRINGVNLTSSGPPVGGDRGDGWGSYLLIEPIGGEWAGRHFLTDRDGNVYRASKYPWNANLDYMGTDWRTYQANGFYKNSNGSANDWSDLINLTLVLSNAPDDRYVADIGQVANIREWMTYFAVCNFFDYRETSLCRGIGDDYALYRGISDPRFLIVGHDFDTILGQGDTSGNANRTIWEAVLNPASYESTNRANFLIRFMRHPDTAPIYLSELKRLCDTTCSPAQIGQTIDQFLRGVVTEQTITAMKTFASNRVNSILSQIPQSLRLNHNLTISKGYPAASGPTVALYGSANAITTRSVCVNGAPAYYHPWGNWTNLNVALNPGLNRVLVQSFDAGGVETERMVLDILYEDGSTVTVSGTLAANTTWTAAEGPYYVSSTVTVPSGVTLTIQPGTTVNFGTGAGINVTGTGRLLAEGTETNRIRFTHLLGGTGTWGNLSFNNTTVESRVTYTDIEYTGFAEQSILANSAIIYLDHLSFSNTAVQHLTLNNSSFNVRNSLFCSLAGAELVHGTGLPATGYGIIESNLFGTTTGLNDIIDFTGGQRPGAILQVLGNTFTAASDDHLDLDGTDALIEGNIFMNAHQEVAGGDTSSAISGGVDSGNTSELTIVRNLFFNCDHAALAKEGNFYTFVNNTIVHMTRSVLNFSEPARGTAGGAGARLDGNIIWDTPALLENFTNGVMTVTINRSILPTNFPGTGNLVADPLLMNTEPSSVSFANIRDAFRLRPGSPALGTGPNGLDMGGLVPGGASISGEPVSPTAQTTATLTIGGPGIVSYRYRMNSGPWSAEVPITTPLVPSGLADGSYTVYITGKNDAGVWQDSGHPTASRTWTVNHAAAKIRINEILALNSTAFAHDGTYPDAVELYNVGGTGINLAGWGLSDEAGIKFKFVFPANTLLLAGQYLVVYADSRTDKPGIHLGFGLDQAGDALYLCNATGAVVDSVQFGTQLADLSIGRRADGQWTLCSPTLGTANQPYPLGDPHALKINEWLANGRTLFPDDFVEIYNPNPVAVPLGGLYLTDEPVGWLTRHQVPSLTFAAAGEHYVFLADGNAEAGANHLSFKLAAERGSIGLLDAQTNFIDCVFYGPQIADTSEGRRPSGASLISKFGPATGTQPTPGAPNPGLLGIATISNIVVDVFGVTDHLWKYNNSGTDLGMSWRQPEFNDGAWSSGYGLFGYETTPAVYPYPFQTTVPAPEQTGGHLTVYYRTHFQWTNGPGFALTSINYVDDGAVFYLNGKEAARVRITANPVTYSSPAQNLGSEGTPDILTLISTNLVDGDNVLAVEVHQPNCCGSGTSSDDVFGMALTAVKTVTNIVRIPVVLNEVLANNLAVTTPGTTNVTDWIELYNPSSDPTVLDGMSLSDTIATPRRWVFPPGVTLPAGGYLLVRFDDSQPASTNTSGPLNTGFGLGADGDEVYLFAAGQEGTLLDAVVFGPQAVDFSIGRVPNATGPWALTLPTAGSDNIAAALGNSANLRINEWLANPSGNDDDFFELYNPNPQPVDLSDHYLTDNLLNRTKFKIPKLSFIGVGENGFLRYIADSHTERGADHVNFGLSLDGESVALFSPAQAQIDGINFGAQEKGVSEGRFPNGSSNVVRFRGTATPGRSNLLPLESVVINEVLTHSDPPLEDAIELYNPGAFFVDVSGWYLSDRKNDPKRFRIPDGTVLPPGGFVVVYENQFNADFTGRPPYFALSSAEGEELYLHPADADGNLTGYRASAKFGAAENGVSIGRYETSVDVDFTALSQRTFGVDNPADVQEFRLGTGLPNAYPLVGPVVINEIMYHPPDLGTNDNVADEFIELHNISAAAVPLYDPNYPTNTWRLRDAVDFNFPPNTTLAANGFLLVVSFDPQTNAAALAAFRSRYSLSTSVPILGPYDGKLANDNENIELYKPDAPVAAGDDLGIVPYILAGKVKYFDHAPWPSAADGNTNGVGASLQRRNGNEYGNDPVNWLAGVPTPGAANGGAIQALPVITGQPQSQSVPLGANVGFSVVAEGAAPLGYQWRFNGVNLSGATNAALALGGVQITNGGRYSVLVMNAAGPVLSATAVLTVQAPPVILSQPQTNYVAVGGTATFAIAVQGTMPMSYQWHFAGSALAGATNPVLVLHNAQTNQEGNYTVVAANAYGSATSAPVALVINAPPLIHLQPQSASVFVDTPVSFSVVATGRQPLHYQWRFNGANLPNATNTTYTISSAQLVNAGNYSVFITNPVGSALSSNATLTVSIPPYVSVTATDPAAAEAGPDAGTFTISRTGNLSLPLAVYFAAGGTARRGSDYALSESPVTIPAGNASVPLPVVPVDDAEREANETVILRLAGSPEYALGSATNATIVIADNDNILPSVAITNPVAGARFAPPTNLVIAASAQSGNGTIARVEFFVGTTNKLGEAFVPPYALTWTNPPVGSHVLTAVVTDDVGATASSPPVSILVASPGFADMFVDRGQLAGYTNYVTGNNAAYTKEPGEPRHTYNGYGNGTRSAWVTWTPPVSGPVTMDTLGSGFDTMLVVYTNSSPAVQTVSNLVKVIANDDADQYTLQSKVAFNVTAGIAYQIVVDSYTNVGGAIVFHMNLPNPYPAFVTQPQSQTVNPGATVTFTAVVTGPAPFTYQWQFNGANLVNATNTSLVVTNVRAPNEGIYTVIASNTNGSTASMPAVLALRPPPMITTPVTNLVVNPGSNVTFSVSATGDAPLSYQWRFNGLNVSGATANILVCNNVQHTNGGTYAVIVSNPAGSATSQAELIVRPVLVRGQVGTNGLYQLMFRGTPGRSYGVEVSTNLVDWAGAGTVSNTAVLMPYEEPAAPGPAPRLYRLRVLP